MKRAHGKNKVKAWYDKDEDILYMLFKEGPSHEVIEAYPDIHLELRERRNHRHRNFERGQKRINKAGGKSHSRNNP